MTDHTIHAFDDELSALRTSVANMGSLAERLLRDAVAALLESNTALAADVVRDDYQLDIAQREVEALAVQMIARRQPVADDLRQIVSAMRMASEIERVGDLAKNIAKRASVMQAPLDRRSVSAGVQHLSKAALGQLSTVLQSFIDGDIEVARAVRASDGRIDDLYMSLFRELLTYMMEDPRSITVCAQLLFCAKNLERVGDHATNLAETIDYALSGEVPALDRPRGATITAEV